MKIIKKILLFSLILTPLFTYACNTKEQGTIKETTKPIEIKEDKDEPVPKQDPNLNQNLVGDKKKNNTKRNIDKPTLNDKIEKPKEPTEEELINEIKEIYKVIYPTYQKFTNIAVFAPKEWLREDESYLKNEYHLKYLDTFNENFLDKSLQPKSPQNFLAQDSYIITSKEEFDTYIINRFKELNPFNEFFDDQKIKKLFEELYLENKDAYNILDNYNIVITTVSPYKYLQGAGYIIPIYQNNKTYITSISGHELIPESVWHMDALEMEPIKWEVFLVNKNHVIEYKTIWRKEDETLLSFKDKFVKWYKEVFKKQHP